MIERSAHDVFPHCQPVKESGHSSQRAHSAVSHEHVKAGIMHWSLLIVKHDNHFKGHDTHSVVDLYPSPFTLYPLLFTLILKRRRDEKATPPNREKTTPHHTKPRHPKEGGEEKQHRLKGAACNLLWANVTFSLTSSSLWAVLLSRPHQSGATFTLFFLGGCGVFLPLPFFGVVLLFPVVLPFSPFGWCCGAFFPLLLEGGAVSSPPPFGWWCFSSSSYIDNTHAPCQRHSIRRGGKATTATEGKTTQPRRREENNIATQEKELGKQQHPTRKRGGKQHAPRRLEQGNNAQPPKKGCVSSLLWAGVAFPLFSFGCWFPLLLCVGVAVLPPSLDVVLLSPLEWLLPSPPFFWMVLLFPPLPFSMVLFGVVLLSSLGWCFLLLSSCVNTTLNPLAHFNTSAHVILSRMAQDTPKCG